MKQQGVKGWLKVNRRWQVWSRSHHRRKSLLFVLPSPLLTSSFFVPMIHYALAKPVRVAHPLVRPIFVGLPIFVAKSSYFSKFASHCFCSRGIVRLVQAVGKCPFLNWGGSLATDGGSTILRRGIRSSSLEQGLTHTQCIYQSLVGEAFWHRCWKTNSDESASLQVSKIHTCVHLVKKPMLLPRSKGLCARISLASKGEPNRTLTFLSPSGNTNDICSRKKNSPKPILQIPARFDVPKNLAD